MAIYKHNRLRVRTVANTKKEFEMNRSVNQESALSSLLFIFIMEEVIYTC